MRFLLLFCLFFLAACKSESEATTLPRPATDMPDARGFTEWAKTGKEIMPLENIVSELEPIWQPVASCQALGHTETQDDKTYRYHYLYYYSREAQAKFDLGCEMENNGYYVSHVARVKKMIWSDYDKKDVPRAFHFFRIRDAEGNEDFAIYYLTEMGAGDRPRVSGCDHDALYCEFSYHGPHYVINLTNGLFTRFPRARIDRNEYPELAAPVALLRGLDSPEMAAFVGGEVDGIPRTLALRALVREVHRQYPEGASDALDLTGIVRHSSGGIVVEDVGINFGLRGTNASYLVKLSETPDCEDTENPDVRQCFLNVSTSFRAYDTRSGSTQTKIAQIANVAAAGTQTGKIEALFAREESGWRLIVTEEIARFLSGVDRQNNWVVRTSDGRTLQGGDAAMCIANPGNC